jgi:hypothetical protein
MCKLLTSIAKDLRVGDSLSGIGNVGLLNGEGYRWDVPHSHQKHWAIVEAEHVTPINRHNVVTFEHGKVIAVGDLPDVALLLAAEYPRVMGAVVMQATAGVCVGNNSTVILPGTGHDVRAGDHSTVVLGHSSTVHVGDESVITVGPDSKVVAGQRSRCIINGGNVDVMSAYSGHIMVNGSACRVETGSNSIVCCRSPENEIRVGNGSSVIHTAAGARVVAEEACTITVGNDGFVVTGPRCVVTAGYDSCVAGSYGTVICLRYVDDVTGLMYVKTGTVDEQTLNANTLYRLNNAHEFERCS